MRFRLTVAAATAAFSAVLVLSVAVPAAAATNVFHRSLRSLGATAEFNEVRDGVYFETGAAIGETLLDDGTFQPLFLVHQSAYEVDADGDVGTQLWLAFGETTSPTWSIDNALTGASAQADALDWTVCDTNTWICETRQIAAGATWIGSGPLLHGLQRMVGGYSRQMQSVFHNTPRERLATALISIDGVTYGPGNEPTNGFIVDSHFGEIFITISRDGALTTADTGITAQSTFNPYSLREIGEGVRAGWSSQADGLISNTSVFASSSKVLVDGTLVESRPFSFFQTVYEDGSETPLVQIFTLEGATADVMEVSPTLGTGTVTAAAAPVLSCTSSGGEFACIESTLSFDGQWTGVGPITHEHSSQSQLAAGRYRISQNSSGSFRAASVVATVDGAPLGDTSDAQLSIVRSGFRSVTFGE